MQHFWIRTIVIAGTLVAANCRPSHEPLEKLKKQLETLKAENQALVERNIQKDLETSNRTQLKNLEKKLTSLQAENRVLTKKNPNVAELQQIIKELRDKNEVLKAKAWLNDKLTKCSAPIHTACKEITLAGTVEKKAYNSIFPQLFKYLVGIRVKAVHTNNNIRCTSNASGSGVMIDSRGYIITNSHCIPSKCERSITVTLAPAQGGGTYEAEFIERDKNHDLALLKISENSKKWKEEDFDAIKFGQSDKLVPIKENSQKDREILYMIGENAFHSQRAPQILYYTGSVGDCTGSINGYEIDQNSFLLCNYTSIPGNSGGPVVNESLELVAINQGTFACHSGIYGIAIAVNTVKKFIRQHIPDFEGN